MFFREKNNRGNYRISSILIIFIRQLFQNIDIFMFTYILQRTDNLHI